MKNDRIIAIAFCVSVLGHGWFLCIPQSYVEEIPRYKPKDPVITLEFERPTLLPHIETLGEEKKLKELERPKEEPQSEVPPETVKTDTQKSERISEEVSFQEILEEDKHLEETPEVVEEYITITDPAQEALFRYQDMVKQRIQSVRRYPTWAQRHGIEGNVMVQFVLLASGHTQDIQLLGSSGSRILDQAGLNTVKRASPFPPIPSQIGKQHISIIVTIVFKVK